MELYFDMRILIILLLVGACIKHVSPIANRFIPFILMVSGVVLSVIINNQILTIDSFVTGIVSGAASVGLHQSGKITFATIATMVTVNIAGLIGQSSSDNAEADGELVSELESEFDVDITD